MCDSKRPPEGSEEGKIPAFDLFLIQCNACLDETVSTVSVSFPEYCRYRTDGNINKMCTFVYEGETWVVGDEDYRSAIEISVISLQTSGESYP